MYPRLILCSAMLALAGVATAQQNKPTDAAKTFSLDLAPAPGDGATPTPPPMPTASPTAAPVAAPMTDSPPPTPADAAVPPAVRAVFTLDTPIQDLIADPGAKAVLDKDLPGMSDDENIDKFKMLSLRSLQPQTGGQLTDALLAKVAADLDVLGGGTGMVTAPLKVGNAKRGKDDSR